MFPFADVVHLFPYKLSGLRTWRFAFACIFMSTIQGFFFRHTFLLLQNSHAGEGTSIEPILYALPNLVVSGAANRRDWGTSMNHDRLIMIH